MPLNPVPNYPGSLDSLPDPTATIWMDDDGFEQDLILQKHNAILEALEVKLGTGGSTPAAGTVLRGTATGASAFGQIVSTDIDASVLTALAATNSVINGDFSVWQRGLSFTATGYTADHWILNNTSAAVVQVGLGTSAPPPSASVPLSPYIASISVTTADTSVAAGDFVFFDQPIEGSVWAGLAQRQMTVSFWVRATKTGKHCVALISGNASQSCVGEYTVSASNTWEYKTITFPASPVSGTWNYSNGVGIYLRFVLMSGTSTSSPLAWIGGNIAATTGVVNDCDSTSNIFQLSQVNVTSGPFAAPFAPRPIAAELALCQRYCEVITGPAQYWGAGVVMVTTSANLTLPYKASKRAAPTLTFGPTPGDFQLMYSNAVQACTSIASTGNIHYAIVAPTVAGGLTAGTATLGVANSANAKITIDAEL